MIRQISIAILIAYCGAASAGNVTQTEIPAKNTGLISGNSSSLYAFRDGLNGFVINDRGTVRLSSADNKPAAVVTAGTAAILLAANTYTYDSNTGINRISLIDRKNKTAVSMQPESKGSFAAASAYGQVMWVPSSSYISYEWSVISGDISSPWVQIMYLLGAPYGSTQQLNSQFPVTPNWGRVSGGYGYGIFKQLDGATYGKQERLDASFAIPLDWVKIDPTYSGGYGSFMYVGYAPPGAEIWANSYFPIPYTWVRVSTGGAGFGRYRNTVGVPSGTQWYVDASWGIPSGWSFVSGGYPMRIARKN
jgi:hypothetical protein